MSGQDDGQFKRHEQAYAQWLTAHPQGFVLLARTLTIHRATCRSVRPLRQAERRSGLLGVWASCSRGISPLEYVLMMIDGAVHLCARCKPQSDPVGFGMHVEYADKMRAHLAKERELNKLAAPADLVDPSSDHSVSSEPQLVESNGVVAIFLWRPNSSRSG